MRSGQASDIVTVLAPVFTVVAGIVLSFLAWLVGWTL